MNFDTITLNQNMETGQNYATWILIALFFYIETEDFDKDIAGYV